MPPEAIRAAEAADLPAVLGLLRHLHPEDPVVDPGTLRETWTTMLGSGLLTVLLAERDRVAAATCTLVCVPHLTRGARPFGVIENVVTHPEHRRRGFGRALLRHALDRAWAAGCYKVMLATGSQRPETLRFYEGAGFERGGKTCFLARRP